MITAFQQHGHGDDVIQLFEQMLREGVEPDYITFVSVLSACSHNGLVRRTMESTGLRKETGCSWIDVWNETYVFTVHDRSHDETEQIYEMLGRLKELVKAKGYAPDTQFAINDVEEHKEQSMWYHSERLALSFGLISLPVNAPIRIKKNLRTCGDCHTVMKLVSEIFRRKIILRDANRFHQFADGSCSCKDYW
ncbi:PPR repeat [Musa troglodytarum]|uniref:PPR repeat n=1 Tax=Musa troglodytarum TaxID=320322 RepID=A0A9E7IBR0_9LILI|nr:PPR repeat [Musa troglodytarum]